MAQQKARRDAEKAIVRLASRQGALKEAPSGALQSGVKSRGIERNLFFAEPEMEYVRPSHKHSANPGWSPSKALEICT